MAEALTADALPAPPAELELLELLPQPAATSAATSARAVSSLARRAPPNDLRPNMMVLLL